MKWTRTADNIISCDKGRYRIVKIKVNDHFVYSLFSMRPEKHIAASRDLEELKDITEKRN